MLKKAMMLTVAAGALTLASLPARAGDISVSVGIDAYPISTVIHYGDRPRVYYAPAPVYYAPPVVYAPRVVYHPAPVVYHRVPPGHVKKHWHKHHRAYYHDGRRGHRR